MQLAGFKWIQSEVFTMPKDIIIHRIHDNREIIEFGIEDGIDTLKDHKGVIITLPVITKCSSNNNCKLVG